MIFYKKHKIFFVFFNISINNNNIYINNIKLINNIIYNNKINNNNYMFIYKN